MVYGRWVEGTRWAEGVLMVSDAEKRRFAEFERAGWEEVAAGYARASDGSMTQVCEPLLDAAEVRAGDRVLDVATGPGWTAAAAAARGAEVTGVDISAAMLDEARRRHPDIRFEMGAAEDLPFEDGSFDVVVSAFGMPHFADHEAVFRECHRVLADSGRLAVASWNPPQQNPFFAVALGAIAQCGSLDVNLPQGVDMFAWADDEVCRQLFTSTGFGEHSRTEVELQFVSNDGPGQMQETLENASVRSRALFQAQTDQARTAILAKIADMLEPMESNGTWTIPATAFLLAAKRR